MSQPSVFTPATLAQRWGCSKTSIIRMMKRGDLMRMNYGLIRFDLAQIERIESGQQKAKGNLVYFIRGGDLVKIGDTQDIIYRFRALAASSPVPLTLVGTISGGKSVEKEMHKRFASLRRHGEWFSYEGELAEYMDKTFGEDGNEPT